MHSEDELIVWSSMLDGKYTVQVIWTAPYCGGLSIADGATVLYRQPVGLAHNAQFGPDVDNVQSWQRIKPKSVSSSPLRAFSCPRRCVHH